MKVKYVKLDKTVQEPTLGSELAGGYDVRASKIEFKDSGRVRVHLDLAVEVPEGYRLMLIPRSSITKSTYQLQNSIGLIDADYRGGIQARFITAPTGIYEDYSHKFNLPTFSYPDFPHKEGDRIGQVYLEKIIPIEWEEVDTLSETVRGEGGHGSTGNK